MKVAILTMFSNLDRTYSLVNVVAEHLAMLLKADIKTKILVCEGCPASERTGIYSDERIEWAEVTNTLGGKQIVWYDYCQPSGEVHPTFFQEAEVIANDLVEKLTDVDVCIMHDIHFQGWHLIHNVAIRKAQESLPHVKFIAFTHSAPFNRPNNPEWPFSARYTPMPKTTYIFPSQAGIPHLAKQYNVAEGKCRVINNSLNLLIHMNEGVQELAKQIDILSPDILIIYPTRLTPGKRLEKVAALAGAISKTSELKIKVIFCDFPSGDIKPEIYKEMIRREGQSFGLEPNNILFTTDLGFPYGFPRQGVLDLFTLSNLFIFPSYSEAFPLILLEAASRGNFLVVNERVPALEEIGKNIHAYFMRWDARNFGFDTHETYHPSEEKYLEDHARQIVNLIRENPVLFAKTLVRQRYSPEWIWENQFEPLLEG
ncbi:MAG: glycosyltransferase [Peptococcales bacterium]